MVGRWLEDGWKMGIIWNNMGQSSHAGQLFRGKWMFHMLKMGKDGKIMEVGESEGKMELKG